MRIILINFSLGLLLSCNNHLIKKTTDSKISLLDNTIDSAINHVDSITIMDNHFLVIYKNPDSLIILRDKDTILREIKYNNGFVFEDFNSDGYKDLIVDYVSNVGGIKDVYLFNPQERSFKLVDDLSKFPSPIQFTQNYYYSYTRAGCADAYWISMLFEIKNYKTNPLGEIYGQGCEEVPKKIDIFKIAMNEQNKRILIETLPLDTIERYTNTKWGFIKDYWTKNYLKFIK